MAIDSALRFSSRNWLLLLLVEQSLQHVEAAVGEKALQGVGVGVRSLLLRLRRVYLLLLLRLLCILNHLRLGGHVIGGVLTVRRCFRPLTQIRAGRQIGLQELQQAGRLLSLHRCLLTLAALEFRRRLVSANALIYLYLKGCV